MATKCCYILSGIAFIFLLQFFMVEKRYLSGWLHWNRGYFNRDCVLLMVFTSPVRPLFSRKGVRDGDIWDNWHMNDLICLKLLHTIFFLLQPFHFLSLIDRRKGSVSQHRHITGKLTENAQKKRKDAHIDPRTQCMLKTIIAAVVEKTLQVPPLFNLLPPYHYLIFRYKHTDCATR